MMWMRRSIGVAQATPVSNNTIYRVEEIIERHLQHMQMRVSELEVTVWARELDKMKENIRSADPDLVVLELEQVRKWMK